MTVAIHQPNFVPWLGYFYKIHKCDVFVLLDNVQFTKNGFTNRNRIKTPQGELWLTIPVVQSGKFGQDIDQCKVFSHQQAFTKILKTVEANYRKTPGFKLYFEGFSNILNSADDSLCELNVSLIEWVNSVLGITTKMIRSSELKDITGENTERLVSICQNLKADAYLAGLGAKKYQDDELFHKAGLEIITTPFKYPVYTQPWGDFMPGLSVLDVLFNCAEKAPEVLRNAH